MKWKHYWERYSVFQRITERDTLFQSITGRDTLSWWEDKECQNGDQKNKEDDRKYVATAVKKKNKKKREKIQLKAQIIRFKKWIMKL